VAVADATVLVSVTSDVGLAAMGLGGLNEGAGAAAVGAAVGSTVVSGDVRSLRVGSEATVVE
jgi:hypothetical protein